MKPENRSTFQLSDLSGNLASGAIAQPSFVLFGSGTPCSLDIASRDYFVVHKYDKSRRKVQEKKGVTHRSDFASSGVELFGTCQESGVDPILDGIAG